MHLKFTGWTRKNRTVMYNILIYITNAIKFVEIGLSWCPIGIGFFHAKS